MDTLETHRRQGYAVAASLYLMHLMKEKGKPRFGVRRRVITHPPAWRCE